MVELSLAESFLAQGCLVGRVVLEKRVIGQGQCQRVNVVDQEDVEALSRDTRGKVGTLWVQARADWLFWEEGLRRTHVFLHYLSELGQVR